MPQLPPESRPTLGGGVLISNGPNGWDPGALLFTTPLVLLRYSGGVCRLFAQNQDEPFLVGERDPLLLVDEVLDRLRQHVPKAGPKAGKPSFPMALVAATYEFGRSFDPHQDAFPRAAELEDDELFASFFIDAFRPSVNESTERVGYAGSIPAGWMEGAPALETTPYGHEPPPVISIPMPDSVEATPLLPVMTRKEYETRLSAIAEYLAAGDIYQANLTIPLRGTTPAPPEAIFDAGLQLGGASYAGMLLTPTGALVSFSPELYLRRRGAKVQTRPIKGTRAIPNHMGGSSEAAEFLHGSAKDRAEHLMIVDLERNDLGRVCRTNTIEVDPLMRAIEHPGVMHLESWVKGQLPVGVTVRDLFAATFPGGSVTGTPKKRALEILAELEIAPRGYYCGAFGWIDCEGDCELNLPIRTAMIRSDGTVEFSAGGGIVADSKPQEEWEEILLKTSFFQRVLETAAK